jgi:methylated-DNA-[protein]-cysteine S-methyltransferase
VVFQQICLFSSRLGWFGLGWCDPGLAAVTFGYSDREQARGVLEALGTVVRSSAGRNGGPLRDLIPRFCAYGEGEAEDFLDVPLDLSGLTDFQQRVSVACRQIVRGQTSTYGELAFRVGAPRAARAVGRVMACNRLPIVIPCHRVLGAAGRLGGYSAPGGLVTKRALLRLEGVHEFSVTKG